jgi:hypothetical protein
VRRLLSALPALIGVVACSAPQPDAPPAFRTVSSDTAGRVRFDSAGRSWLRLTSVRWDRARDEYWRDSRHFLVREEKQVLCCAEAERETFGVLQVTVWPDTVPDVAPLWGARFEADDADLWNGFYRTVLRGCCDAADLYEYHPLRAGGRPYQVSVSGMPLDSALPRLAAPNSALARYVAFHDGYAPRDPPESRSFSNLIGVLQYGGPEGPRDRVLVLATDSTLSTVRLRSTAFVVNDTARSGHAADLWSAGGATTPESLTGFRVRVTFFTFDDGAPLSLDIPVDRDRLVLNRAVVPRGVRLMMGR